MWVRVALGIVSGFEYARTTAIGMATFPRFASDEQTMYGVNSYSFSPTPALAGRSNYHIGPHRTASGDIGLHQSFIVYRIGPHM